MDHAPAPTASSPDADPTTTGIDASTSAIPFWLRSLGAFSWRVLVIIALVAVLLVMLYTIGVVTASVALAAVASVAVIPVVRSLRGRGWSATKAAAAGTGIVFGVVILVIAIAALVLVRYGPDIVAALDAGMADLQQRETSGAIAPQLAEAITNLIEAGKAWVSANAGSVVSDVSNLFSVLLFGAFTTFFVLSSDLAWWRWLTQDLDDGGRSAAVTVAKAGEDRLGAYLRFIAVLAIVEALVDFIIIAVLGVPLAIPLATLVFVGGFVPYVGGIVVALAILLVALASIGPLGTLVLFILLGVVNVFLDRVVARPLDRPGARVNPAIAIIALPIGAYVAGFFGLVMAVPVTVALLAIGSALMVQLRASASARTSSSALVPPWLDLLAGWSWRLLAGTALFVAVAIPILNVPMLSLPLIIAGVLAPTLSPAVGALQRRGWGRSVSAGVVTGGVTAVILLITGLAIAALVGNVANLAGKAGEGAATLDDAVGGLSGLLTSFTEQLTTNIAQIVTSVSTGLATAVLVVGAGVILTFIGLRDGRRAWERWTAYLAPWRRSELDGAADRAVSVTSGYMLGTGAISVFGAATQLVIMVILGVPLALPVFVLSVFGGYIPYIGSLLTTLLAVVLTVTTGNPVAVVIMLVWTVVFNVVTGNVIQPIVFSKAVNINAAIILLAIPAGGALAGVLGMFLVVPVLGVVGATWRSLLKVMGEPPAGDVPVVVAGDRPAPAATPVGAAPAANPA